MFFDNTKIFWDIFHSTLSFINEKGLRSDSVKKSLPEKFVISIAARPKSGK